MAAAGNQELGEAFAHVNDLHATFHRVAASVVRSKKAGSKEAAAKSLGVGGEFGRASGQHIHALMKIEQSEHEQHEALVSGSLRVQ